MVEFPLKECYRSTFADIPSGIDFISERKHRNSARTQVMVTQEVCKTHQDAEDGQAELYRRDATR